MQSVWEDHEQRMIDEYNELDEKVVKLSTFVEKNHLFTHMDHEDQRLMSSQLDHMKAYRGVLNKRIVRMTLAKYMPVKGVE